MKKIKALIIMTLSLFILWGCSSGSSANDSISYESSTYTNGSAIMKDYGYTASTDAVYSTEEIESKIIVNSNIYMETKEFTNTTDALEKLVNTVGGYIQSSNVYTSSGSLDTTGYRNADYTLRIPATNYNEFMAGAAEIGNVTSVRTSTDDVTTSYYDTQTRVENLKAQEERLLDLYKKADTIEEIIQLENRISNLRYEIESNELKIRNWDLLTKYCTITIDITEVKDLTIETVGYFDELWMSFVESGSMFTEVIQELTLFLARYSTFIATGAIIVLLVNTVSKRNRKKFLEKLEAQRKQREAQEKSNQ